YGACPSCGGLGTIMEFDQQLIVPDTNASLSQGAVEAWRKNGKRMNIYYNRIVKKFCRDFEVDANAPFKKLKKSTQRILLRGTNARDQAKYGSFFEGVIPNLQRRFENSDSEFVKSRLHSYMSQVPCETCNGAR